MWPGQYEVCTVRYNYTRRDGTKVGTVQKSEQYICRDSIKVGTVHTLGRYIILCTVPPTLSLRSMYFRYLYEQLLNVLYSAQTKREKKKFKIVFMLNKIQI